MDGRLIKSGAHQRFIRMLIDKTNNDKKSMISKAITNKTGTYKNSIKINDIKKKSNHAFHNKTFIYQGIFLCVISALS
jgi:hypothetical protein